MRVYLYAHLSIYVCVHPHTRLTYTETTTPVCIYIHTQVHHKHIHKEIEIESVLIYKLNHLQKSKSVIKKKNGLTEIFHTHIYTHTLKSMYTYQDPFK